MPLAVGYPFVIGRDLMSRFGFRLALSPLVDCMSKEATVEESVVMPKMDPDDPTSVSSPIVLSEELKSSLITNSLISSR